MKRVAVFSVLVMLFPSCVTAQETENRDKIDRIVEAAYALDGKTEVVVGGRRFNSDCSGLIYGLYSAAGIDLQSAVARYKGDGVKRIYQLMDENGLLYYAWVPVPGDLIFWDNTYDKNGDGRENDYLTHIGVVVSVEDDGQISYIHYHTGRGIMIEQMNMFQPHVYADVVDGKTVVRNSYMRASDAPDSRFQLAGELCRNFAMGYALPLR